MSSAFDRPVPTLAQQEQATAGAVNDHRFDWVDDLVRDLAGTDDENRASTTGKAA